MNTIDKCDILVALFDKIGRENQWVNQEVGYAMARNIQILGLVDHKEKLKGLVNKETHTVIEGKDKPLPDKLEKILMDFWKEHEEEIYQRIIKEEILKIRKIIELEESKLQKDHSEDPKYKMLDGLKQLIYGLQKDYDEPSFYQGFYRMKRLVEIKERIDKIVERSDFPEIFKTHLSDFAVNLQALIDARTMDSEKE
jgi:hypothetical protein